MIAFYFEPPETIIPHIGKGLYGPVKIRAGGNSIIKVADKNFFVKMYVLYQRIFNYQGIIIPDKRAVQRIEIGKKCAG